MLHLKCKLRFISIFHSSGETVTVYIVYHIIHLFCRLLIISFSVYRSVSIMSKLSFGHYHFNFNLTGKSVCHLTASLIWRLKTTNPFLRKKFWKHCCGILYFIVIYEQQPESRYLQSEGKCVVNFFPCQSGTAHSITTGQVSRQQSILKQCGVHAFSWKLKRI